ncbi:MAG: N-acetylglucosamine-6-phosphate deacetylase [Chloroflexi bacterium]|nr:MAG: N-acetylglucosamine-6-phosphate deacetylase [Chloroflexota bacterium]
MSGVIRGARILTPEESMETGTVVFDGAGRITAVGSDAEPPPSAEITEGRGLTLAPGFIDLHVHGGGGFSLATEDSSEIESYARWVISRGVTGFLATVFASDFDEALAFVGAAGYVSDQRHEGGAEILGINLEGPFVNPQRRGALPESWVRAPNPVELAALSNASEGSIKLTTLAPEIPNAGRLLQIAHQDRIVVAIGHTDATYEEALGAFEGGASHVTHAFNGMRPFHHRDPGPVLAAIDSPNVTLELIADGVHLHPATVRSIRRAVGTDRITLVSDAVAPAGLDSGVFQLGSEKARLTAGRVLLPDGTIAGGASTMDRIVRNVVEWGVAGLTDAVRMASTVPARVLGLSERKGRIVPGYDADLVALDSDLNVAMTWVAGRLVYTRGEHFN